MMEVQILGFHIISDVELRKCIDDAREEQRTLETAITSKLLHSAETYRRVAEKALGQKIRVGTPLIDKLIEESLQKKKH